VHPVFSYGNNGDLVGTNGPRFLGCLNLQCGHNNDWEPILGLQTSGLFYLIFSCAMLLEIGIAKTSKTGLIGVKLMPIQYKNVMRRIFPTAHRVLLDRLIADHARDVTGDVLVLGAGMTDYRDMFPNAKSVVNTDVDLFGPHIDMCLDAHTLPLDADQYDYVVAIEVFEHLHNPEQACNEIYRVLKKGGVFLLTIPFLFRIHGDPSDYIRFTGYGLASMLSCFANKEVSSYGGRISVISDLITTASKALVLLRILNLFFHLVPRGGSTDAPSGYLALAVK